MTTSERKNLWAAVGYGVVASVALWGGIFAVLSWLPTKEAPPSGVVMQHLPGVCFLVPGTDGMKLKIEMRTDDAYLVRVTPWSLYRTQIGYWVDPRMIDALPIADCPKVR